MQKQEFKDMQAELKKIQEQCKTETPENVDDLYDTIEALMDRLDVCYNKDEDSDKCEIACKLEDIIWAHWGDNGENSEPMCDFEAIANDIGDIIKEIEDML